MDSSGDATPRRKAAPTTKVKVVASRYAQAIQKSNLEAKPPAIAARNSTSSDRSRRSVVASSSSNAASIKVGSSRAATLKSAAQTRPGIVSSVSKTPVPSTPAMETTSRGAGTASFRASSSESTGSMSISDKLRLYKASKSFQRSSVGSALRGRSAPTASDPLRAAPRPTIPERITPPTEKAPSRGTSRASGTSTPIKRRAGTPSLRPTPATISHQTRPHSASTPFQSTTSTAHAPAVARVPASTTEEELELLESLYLQLCFAEAKAAESFQRQEQNAERQMVTAWEGLQSKLQLLHDTSIRLDRELHVRSVEEHLQDQAEPFVRLASTIESFNDDLAVIRSSMEASLQRMPTPGVVSNPPELKRQLEGLSSTLEVFSIQLKSDGMGSTVAEALTFTRTMEESTEQICSLLLQVGHILEEIQLEVNTETSLKSHAIQEARVRRVTQAAGWW